MGYSTDKLSEHVGIITLNNPDKLNALTGNMTKHNFSSCAQAFSEPMGLEFVAQIEDLRQSASLRALVQTSS